MTTDLRLSDRQRDLLLAINDYQIIHHFCPTVRELGKLTGISSTNVVHWNLNRLQELGLVSWEPFVSRTIRVNESVLPPVGPRNRAWMKQHLKKQGKR